MKQIDLGRFYKHPHTDRWLPSATTVLGAFDRQGLDDWQKAVGQEEAEKVRRLAAAKGTVFHNLVEQYLKRSISNDFYTTYEQAMPDTQQRFMAAARYLDEIEIVFMQEQTTFSNTFPVAGRLDCYGVFNGINSIIDFKTSRKIKTREDIHHYFEQEAIYSYCMYDSYREKIPRLVTIMSVEEDNEALLFIENADSWVDSAMEKVLKYYNTYDWEGK